MMKKRILLATALISLASLLAGCFSTEETPMIQPAQDKLTFVFFYTDV